MPFKKWYNRVITKPIATSACHTLEGGSSAGGLAPRQGRGPRAYAWLVVAMLWLVCLFNYADRQAIFSVFPLLKNELHLTPVQLGVVGSAFMWVYAAAGPLAGLAGDRLPRKTLILGGLAFWSVVTLATALSSRYSHLVLFRALEGLGEAFYFPASMSLISDYHGRATRSRAMAFHQSSVYGGTILGGAAAGFFGQFYGWRSGFYLFGGAGIVLAGVLFFTLRDLPRRQPDAEEEPPAADALSESLYRSVAAFFRNPRLVLSAVFVGANFVAAVFLTWTPYFLFSKFRLSLSSSGWNATAWLQIASAAGAVASGVLADRLARRLGAGRMIAQAIGLLAGAPFLALAGWVSSLPALVLALAGFGFCKGMYDANIWASLYDVVPARRRAASVGIMNSIGWFGASAAPILFAAEAARHGMSRCVSATSAIYLLLAAVLFVLAALTPKRRAGADSAGRSAESALDPQRASDPSTR